MKTVHRILAKMTHSVLMGTVGSDANVRGGSPTFAVIKVHVYVSEIL